MKSIEVFPSDQHRDRLTPSRFSNAWDEFVKRVDLAPLEIDPDDVFADVRDKAPGRETTQRV